MYPLPNQVADDELKRRVNSVLKSHGVGLGTVEAQVSDGTIVLSGILPNAIVKQACLQCCSHVPGVIHIVDGIHISVNESPEQTQKNTPGNPSDAAPPVTAEPSCLSKACAHQDRLSE